MPIEQKKLLRATERFTRIRNVHNEPEPEESQDLRVMSLIEYLLTETKTDPAEWLHYGEIIAVVDDVCGGDDPEGETLRYRQELCALAYHDLYTKGRYMAHILEVERVRMQQLLRSDEMSYARNHVVKTVREIFESPLTSINKV